MRVVSETLEELRNVLVNVGVERDVLHPLVVLVLGGKLTFAQQPGDLEKCRILGELLDGIAPIAEDPLVAVDVGDRTPARGGVHERRIVAQQAEFVRRLLDLTKVHRPDRRIAFGTLDVDGYCILLAGPIIGDSQCVRLSLAHPESPPWNERRSSALVRLGQCSRRRSGGRKWRGSAGAPVKSALSRALLKPCE